MKFDLGKLTCSLMLLYKLSIHTVWRRVNAATGFYSQPATEQIVLASLLTGDAYSR